MYKLGKRSQKKLAKIHPDLALIVRTAIGYTTQDFSVFEGVRTVKRQRALVDSGASRTMQSRHIDRCAVDLVPYILGQLRWEWSPIYKIILAVQKASIEKNVPIRWGGVWDKRLADLKKTENGLHDEVQDYIARKKLQGIRAFTDGPHIELPRDYFRGKYEAIAP